MFAPATRPWSMCSTLGAGTRSSSAALTVATAFAEGRRADAQGEREGTETGPRSHSPSRAVRGDGTSLRPGGRRYVAGRLAHPQGGGKAARLLEKLRRALRT